MLLSQPPSFLRLQKEGDDSIYQALVCLRDASGTVVVRSQSEGGKKKRLESKGGKGLPVFSWQAN